MTGEDQTAVRQEGHVRDPHFIARLVGAAGDRDAPLLRRLLGDLPPPDVAEALEQAPLEAVRAIVRLMGADLPPEMLAYLPWELREEVLALLPPEVVARALGQLDTDDAAAVAADIAEDRLDQVLAAADSDTRIAVQEALSFEEETAGRLMQREFVAAPEFWTVGQVIDKLRASAPDDIPDVFFEIYIVDLAMRPIGAAPVSRFLRTARDTPVKAIMSPPQALIHPEMDQEEVAVLFQKYHLASAPVVDDAGRLTGMVTVDDIVDVVTEESQEDLLKLAGVSEAGQGAGVARSVQARAPWIGVNLATALVSSSVISAFADQIEALVALAVLMPIIASMGGNAGTQALAVAVRAIAARELTGATAARMIAREAFTGFTNGLLFAALLGAVSFAWFHIPMLAVAVAGAVLINFTCAGLAGILVPLALQRAGADPAVSSSVFVTFVTDLVGFFSFLGLASLIVFA